MRKAVIIVMMCLLLSGCDNKSDKINLQGKTYSVITLNDGWFSSGISVDYEKRQVVIQIEKVEE